MANRANPEWEVEGASDEESSSEQPVRKGESEGTWFRSDRAFQVGGEWYLSTREGLVVGPIQSKALADTHERRLVAMLAETSTPEEAQQVIRDYNDRLKSEN